MCALRSGQGTGIRVGVPRSAMPDCLQIVLIFPHLLLATPCPLARRGGAERTIFIPGVDFAPNFVRVTPTPRSPVSARSRPPLPAPSARPHLGPTQLEGLDMLSFQAGMFLPFGAHSHALAAAASCPIPVPLRQP